MFTLLKSADFLHSESQLITKSYLNIEGIVLFVKILFFCQNQGGRKDKKFRSLEVQEASSLHLKNDFQEFQVPGAMSIHKIKQFS